MRTGVAYTYVRVQIHWYCTSSVHTRFPALITSFKSADSLKAQPPSTSVGTCNAATCLTLSSWKSGYLSSSQSQLKGTWGLIMTATLVECVLKTSQNDVSSLAAADNVDLHMSVESRWTRHITFRHLLHSPKVAENISPSVPLSSLSQKITC